MSPHGKKHNIKVFMHPLDPRLRTWPELEFSGVIAEEHTVNIVIENGLVQVGLLTPWEG